MEESKPRKGLNRLMREKSPYLRQHGENPVDWYPWGPEAFAKAQEENKPIFLSIGYSTCHWCHVMAHESFEDPEVARLMNDVFVSIKVDREERPDIDGLYMTVCQLMTGSGGWPLTIIMTPDKKPFFAGTYFPKTSHPGRIGMMDLIPRIKEVWTARHDEVLHSAEKITAALRKTSHGEAGADLTQSTLRRAFEQLAEGFDQEHGGFGGAPKFPTPHNLFFLLRYWRRSGNGLALGMVEKTLQAMRLGGIFDHVGFGFHRYSTDAKWRVPHFEKMLYDQALLAMAYTEAYQATGKGIYRRTAEEIFAYVLRDMTAPTGGFYSGEDADSEGQEGKFYLWTEAEMRRALPARESRLATKVFGIEKEGNFTEEGTRQGTAANILYLREGLDRFADELGMTQSELQEHLDRVREKLFAARETRIHPHKDDKILTDWNGLMIAALAKGGRVLDEPRYTGAARKAVDFILHAMRRPGGRLLHRYREGEAALTAQLDDYAFLVWGLIELYETTFETQYLDRALGFTHDMIQHFWDKGTGGFYFAADDGEKLLVRDKRVYDGAIPSGNSVAAWNFLRLGRITANYDFEKKAVEIGRAFSDLVSSSPSASTQLMTAVDFALGPAYEVVIAGNSTADDTRGMLRTLRRRFVPNKVVVLRPTEEKSPEIVRLAPYTRDQSGIDGKATAYVCRNYACKLPTTDPQKMLESLEGTAEHKAK